MLCAELCLVAQSCLTLCNPMDHNLSGTPVHGDSPGKNTGGIYSTARSNVTVTLKDNTELHNYY